MHREFKLPCLSLFECAVGVNSVFFCSYLKTSLGENVVYVKSFPVSTTHKSSRLSYLVGL